MMRDFSEALPNDLVRVVVGDVHSDVHGLRALLSNVGILDGSGKRQRGFYVVQLGDLIHGGHGESVRDRLTLEEVLEGRWFDEVLCGNHELFHAFKVPAGRFAGMTKPTDRKVGALLQQLHRHGGLTAASAIDGWLVTHAGLHPFHERQITPGRSWSAADLAAFICTGFEVRVRDRVPRDLFDAIGGSRSDGQDQRVGGIFWVDASEMQTATPPSSVPQIFGHSPQGRAPRMLRPNMWCADVGAGLSGLVCALVKRNAEDAWVPIVARSPRGRERRPG